MIEMPLNGRAYTDLLALIPGSVGNGSTYQAAGGQNYSISGNCSEQNDFTMMALPTTKDSSNLTAAAGD